MIQLMYVAIIIFNVKDGFYWEAIYDFWPGILN